MARIAFHPPVVPLRTLSPDNEIVQAGRYKATTLSAVDAELATANIKNGITIFGFAGNANVVDTSSGDAVAGDIRAGIKAWVDGAEVTGDIPEVAIVAGNEAVPAGIHTATTLSAIDEDLAIGNIKSGVIIFGFTGAATIQDISDADAAVGDVKTGQTFYSVTGGIKTGTLDTVALDPGLNEYPEGYHAGEASLTAVDAQLAAGNIKDGITIFGVLGTFEQTLSEDIIGSGQPLHNTDTSAGGQEILSVNAGSDTDLATTTDTYDANSMAVAAGFVTCYTTATDAFKIRLYMDGVNVAETDYLASFAGFTIILVATKALSGSKICKVATHNYNAASKTFYLSNPYGTGAPCSAAVAIGSVKKT